MNFVCTERNGELTCFGKHGRLHVEGKKLLDENDKIVVLHGISTHNILIYPEYINEEAFAQYVDEYGVNIMRFAMYSGEADGEVGYSGSDDDRKRELEEIILDGVRICASLGIYCMVDWHILFDYNPNMNIETAKKFWRSISLRLRNYDNVIYEICNEPNMNLKTNSDAVSWEQVCDYANVIIPLIRDIDETKIIIVGTPLWSQNVDEAADAPLSYENVMYTLHFYADSHKEEVRDKARYALNKDLPIFVTEFGMCNASGDGDINEEETTAWFKLLDDNNISYIIWNLSNKNETSSLIKPDCEKVQGFVLDDLSDSGKRMVEYMKNFK